MSLIRLFSFRFILISFVVSAQPWLAWAETAEKVSKYDYLPSDEVIAIDVGEQKSEVLIRPWIGKKKLGAAIMFANTGMDADSAGLQAFLRRNLTHTGWATISITPPNSVVTPNFATSPEEVAKAGEGKEIQKSSEPTQQFSDETWKKIREKQELFVVQSMDQLDAIGKPFPGKRILITTAQGAGLTISLLSKNKLPKPDILVIINPYMRQIDENQALPKLLAELDLPVLDIQSRDGHRASLNTVERRRELSPHNSPYRYSQQLMSLNLNQETAWQVCLELIEGFAQRINKAYP
ncbi:DUF3530 family protein [uncultured Shewanella sp.]|uniref:DUF3530 family protein n=1 Tax=Shewanella atlantica TaxID=271099 RepID=UPI002602C17C|nr:DUF3530 family protein [uncultured Shewanella sp.]